MTCTALSFQTATLPLPSVMSLVSQADHDQIAQALAEYAHQALGATTTKYPDRVFVTTSAGTASISWDAQNVYVRSYAPALADQIRSLAVQFFTAQAAALLQQKVAAWAVANTAFAGYEVTGAGALVLKVSL